MIDTASAVGSAPTNERIDVEMAAEDRSKQLERFQFERVLKVDKMGARMVLKGQIDDQHAIVLLEKTGFDIRNTVFAKAVLGMLTRVKRMSGNDVYSWFMATIPNRPTDSSTSPLEGEQEDDKGEEDQLFPRNAKVTLIWPSTERHLAKYSPQEERSVTETPETYAAFIRPIIKRKRDEGTVRWMEILVDGEQTDETILYRDDDMMIIPDLTWDQETLSTMHLLTIPIRKDIWSLRELCPSDIPLLERMKQKTLAETHRRYPDVQPGQIKLFFHYPPTYYHLHVHVEHTNLESGRAQAFSSAIGFDAVVQYLRLLRPDQSLADISLTFNVGVNNETWLNVFKPLSEGRQPTAIDEQQ